jgi:hypothetical protein
MTLSITAGYNRLLRNSRPRPAENSVLARLRADKANVLSLAGLQPDEWQRRLIQSKAQRIAVVCGRQTGKSTTCAGLSLAEALTVSGSLVLLVSPSMRQSVELYRRVARLYAALGRPLAAVQESATQVQFGNASRIVSLPGTPDTIRGYSPSLVIVDEAALVDDDLLVAVRPMLAATQGRLIMATTPAGRRGAFYSEWTGTGDWERISIAASACPRIPAAFLREERKSLGDAFYAQEYDCEFVHTVSSVFAEADIQAALQGDVRPLFDPGV